VSVATATLTAKPSAKTTTALSVSEARFVHFSAANDIATTRLLASMRGTFKR
jgi:hypothetical protein